MYTYRTTMKWAVLAVTGKEGGRDHRTLDLWSRKGRNARVPP